MQLVDRLDSLAVEHVEQIDPELQPLDHGRTVGQIHVKSGVQGQIARAAAWRVAGDAASGAVAVGIAIVEVSLRRRRAIRCPRRAAIVADAVLRPARCQQQVGTDLEFRRHRNIAIGLDLVSPVVGQVAVSALHQFRVVPGLCRSNVGLRHVGQSLALCVALALRIGVIHFAVPTVGQGVFSKEVQRKVGALGLFEAQVSGAQVDGGVLTFARVVDQELVGLARIERSTSEAAIVARVDLVLGREGLERSRVAQVVDRCHE